MIVLAAVASGWGALAAAEADSIDWSRARALLQKSRDGGALTDEEKAYLEKAQAARGKGGLPANAREALASLPAADRERARELMQKQRNGETLTEDDRAFIRRIRATMEAKNSAAPAATAAETKTPGKTSFTPLTELMTTANYKGRDGGLYGGGLNEPPRPHLEAALAAAARIAPLDASGKPSAEGKIALLSVGMSNTTQEFSRFKEIADRDPQKSPRVVLVDGAQGGQTAMAWARSAESPIWQTVDSRMKAASVTPEQVQVVWLKQADARPTEAFPTHVEKLTAEIVTILQMLQTKFPNLRVAYLSSRIYGGYATTELNPEPYAYEGAFAVRDVIARQMAGDAALNFSTEKGAVKAPVVLWGPYLWGNGLTPRKTDGLVWVREDFRDDGTHPSDTGRTKVAQLLLTFFKNDRTAKSWFAAGN